MISLTLAHAIELITQYGYLIILPLAIFEGPIVAVIGGLLASLGSLDAKLVFLILLLGDIIGDSLYYGIGRWGRYGFIKKWGAYIGVTQEKIKKLELSFEKYHWKILTIGKTQPIGSVILVSAGLANMPYGIFMWYNILATIPKILLLETIGFYFGYTYQKISNAIDYATIASLAALVALLCAYMVYKKHLKQP